MDLAEVGAQEKTAEELANPLIPALPSAWLLLVISESRFPAIPCRDPPARPCQRFPDMRTTLAVRSLRWLIIAGLVTLISARAADVDALVRTLRDPDKTAEVKGEACLQLMDLGPAAAPAVPALVVLLNSQEEMLRDYAVTTLDRIGPAARNALPALRRTAAKDASAEIRELARSAITRISGHAPASEPASTPAAAAEAEPARPPAEARPEPAITRAEPVITRPEAPPAATETPAAEPEPETPAARPPEPTRRPATITARPTLEVHPGRYYRWAVPIGWTGSESATGVTLTAPDGLMQVSSALLLSSPGKMTPADFTVWMLGQVPENRSLQVIAKKDLPDQPSGLAAPWKVQELEMRYAVNGVPVHAVWTTGIVDLNGTYDAYILGYQSVPIAFERAKLWLTSIAHSIALTSPVQGAGNDRLLIPTNRALDHPALLEAWREQGHSEDRILKAQRDGMMGYEQVKDPQTGHVFEMPLEAWDSAVGGYRNPLQPEEILKVTEAGD